MLDGAAVSAGVIEKAVAFVSDAWPIALPFAGLGLFGLVLLLARRMVD